MKKPTEKDAQEIIEEVIKELDRREAQGQKLLKKLKSK